MLALGLPGAIEAHDVSSNRAAEFLAAMPLREAWWALLLLLLSGAAGVWLFLRWRLSVLSRRQAELEGEVASQTEKLQIANRTLEERAHELRTAENRLRLLFHQTPAGIFVFDQEMRITDCNEQFLSLLDSSRQAMVGSPLSTFKEAEILPAIEAALEGKEGSYEGPCTLSAGSGAAWVTLTAVPLWGEDRQIQGGIGLAVDITERRQTEATLRESEERFRNMADTAPVMIWVADRDKGCTFFNKVWLAFTGRKLEQELGNGWAEGVHPDDREQCWKSYAAAFDARRSFQIEYRLRRADGEYRLLLDSGVPRFAPGGVFSGYIGSCTDITELKRVHEEVLATQKLESLGVLTAGIAHDFNNFLGSILAQAEMAEVAMAGGSGPEEEIKKIQAVAIRAAEVVRELMIYAGQDKGNFEAIDLSQVVREMLELLKVSISKHAVLETDLDEGLPPVMGNATQIRQVVMNLVINASEAIGNNPGIIHVSTSRRAAGEETAQDGTAIPPDGEFLELEVSDTGRGMTDEEKLKVFDPFFTTKFAGRGLGLSVVQGIVRAHGGTIHLKSTLGQGTSFRILLRSATEPAIEVHHAAESPSRAPGSGRVGAVLLVDDEEPLRQSVAKMLLKRGFSVMEAANGSAAIDFIRAQNGLDVIVLDMSIPGASSNDVMVEARRVRPGVKIILTSAYSRQMVRENLDASDAGFIRKPFRLGDLARLLSDALSS